MPLSVLENTEPLVTTPEEAGVSKNNAGWPVKCACGYAFEDDDCWQVRDEVLYRCAQSDKWFTLSEAPAGAMWDAMWLPHKGPDGRSIMVKTPGGEWCMDVPAKDGKPWDRQGEPPELTARPSILLTYANGSQHYHGFLTEGYLEEC